MGSPICWNHRSHSVQGVHVLGIWRQFGAKAAVFFPSKSEEQWPTKERAIIITELMHGLDSDALHALQRIMSFNCSPN